MSESLKVRATILAHRAAWQAQGVTDTEVLAALVEATAEVVRQANDGPELLDRWQFVNGYIFERTREDCANILGSES